MHHGVRIQDGALVAAARAVGPLHHLPLPARQGHRPDGRGGQPPAHRDRLGAGRARRRAAPDHAARDRAAGAGGRDRPELGGPPRGDRRGAGVAARGGATRCAAHWEQEKATIDRIRDIKGQIEAARQRAGAGRARGRPRGRGAAASTAPCPSSSGPSQTANDELAEQQTSRADAQGGGRRGGRGRGRRLLDRRPRQPPAGGRGREAAPHGGAPARAGGGPGGGRQRRGQRPAARRARASRTPTGRSARSSSSARPAWGRPSWPGRSPSSCSTTSAPWSAST